MIRRVFFLLLLAGLIIFFSAVPSFASWSRPRVDPRVLEDVADGQSAQFLVVLKSQANARAAAARAPNRISQGRMVYSALRQAADATQSSVRAQLDALGAKYRAYWIVNMLAVEGDQAVLDAVLARSDVLAVESDRAFRVQLEQAQSRSPLASTTGIEWNVSQVRAPDLWTLGYTGTGQVYANADTGVQWDHPALKPHYRGWNGTTADHNYNWWDAIKAPIVGGSSCGYNSPVPCDDYGHGTHTMGTGIGDDGAGNQIGVAPGAKWIACRNMDDGVGRPSTYIECMQFFLAPTKLDGSAPNSDLRPDAVGNSYGCPIGPPPNGESCVTDSLLAAMNNLRAAGVFMAVSAGNSGYAGCSTVTDPPAVYDSAITIGATDSSDNIAGFSSRGPSTVDGTTFRKPDLVAPGVNVRSSYPTNSYAILSGTSMASPHVAGAVALLWSAVPALARDVDRTEFLLEQSAVHYTTSQGCGGDSPYQYPNNVFGYGRIDVKAAYNLAIHVPTPSTNYFPLVERNN